MSGVVKFVLYWTGYYFLVPKTEWVDWEFSKMSITVCTLQLKNFESCKVNIFQVFLRESEKSLIRGLNKSFEKNRESGVVV